MTVGETRRGGKQDSYLLPPRGCPQTYLPGSQSRWSPLSRRPNFAVFVTYLEGIHALICKPAPSPDPWSLGPPSSPNPHPARQPLYASPASNLWADAGDQWLARRGRALLWALEKAGHREPEEGLHQPANGTLSGMQLQRLPHRLWSRFQNKSLASAQKSGLGFSGVGRGHSLWSSRSPHSAQPLPRSLTSSLAPKPWLVPTSLYLQFVLLLDQKRENW